MTAISWSGGKDSCLAYLRTQPDFSFAYAITMMNEEGIRSRSHGLRPEVIRAQVEALGLQWIHRGCSWSSYETAFADALKEAFARGVTHLVCGDILYPEHKRWVQRMCGEANLEAVEPLWGCKTVDLYEEFLERGIHARIVSVDASKLTEQWLYRQLASSTMVELQRLGVDPCGENGEYHTLVTSCPAFSRTLAVESGDHVHRSGYWAVDVQLASQATSSTSSDRKGEKGL
jgi:diphthine-ammonia ligase